MKKLYTQSILLDGAVFRKIFDKEPDSYLQGRLKVARKISALATFLAESGNLVLCATISCFEEIWELNRQNIKNYFEIYIKCDLDELIKRDQKGLYSGALRSEITNVIGIDLPFNEIKNAYFVSKNSKADHLEAKSALLFEKCLEFLHSQHNDVRKYWQNYYTSHFKPDTQSSFAEFALSYFKEEQNLIELCCGNGRDSVFSQKNNLQVLGVDLASNMIAKLQSDFSKSNLAFLNADFIKLQDLKRVLMWCIHALLCIPLRQWSKRGFWLGVREI